MIPTSGPTMIRPQSPRTQSDPTRSPTSNTSSPFVVIPIATRPGLRRAATQVNTLPHRVGNHVERVFPQSSVSLNGSTTGSTMSSRRTSLGLKSGVNSVPEEDEDGGGKALANGLEKLTVADETREVIVPGFSHEVTGDGSIVVLGRDWIMPRCEDEPIRSPGAIQAFGVMFAVEMDEDENVIVAQVSENCTALLGLSPKTIFSTPCLTHLFPEAGEESIRDALDSLEDGQAEQSLPPGFDLTGHGEKGTGREGGDSRLQWTAFASVRKLNGGRIIMEVEPHRSFEEIEDSRYSSSGRLADSKAALNADGSVDVSILEATTSMARPLKELVRMRNRRAKIILRENERIARGEMGRKTESKYGVGEPDAVQLLTQCEYEMRRTTDFIPFLQIVATLFKDITEFDRAMIYRFDEDWNGEILAEQIDWTRTQTRYRGLLFPETDIPAQARALYAVSPLRLLADREAEVSRMVCRSLEEVDKPLDMSHCVLRALSPMCHKFLKNMGIRSTMSISIMVDQKLWGLVILQHHGEISHRVSFPTQHICRLLGESLGRHIARLHMAAQVATRGWASIAPQIDSSGVMGSADDLLTLFHSNFGVLSLNEEAKVIGTVSDTKELMAVVEYLRRKRYSTTQSSRDIAADCPDLHYPSGFDLISGFISMPLSREGRDFVVFFRAKSFTAIRWAGNPDKTRGGTNGLDPRENFEPYSITKSAKCASWEDELGGIPQALIVIFGRYIDIWRRKESLLSARKLAHSLLIDASAAVRGPLNGIIIGLEEAIASAIDDETRQNVELSYSASLTLTRVINELLDLTKTEVGQALHSTEPFDVGKIIRQSIQVYTSETNVRRTIVSVVEPDPAPMIVIGDAAKLQRIVTNVMSNAVRHTQGGQIIVSWFVGPNNPAIVERPDWVWIVVEIEDSGSGIAPEKMDGMFRFFEHVSGLAEYQIDSEGKPAAVGLGLAQVARIVQTLGGTMGVISHPGEGSKFTFRLPFRQVV